MLKEQLIGWVLRQFTAMGAMPMDILQERYWMFGSLGHLFYSLELLGALDHNQGQLVAYGRTL